MLHKNNTNKAQLFIAAITVMVLVATPALARERTYWRDNDPMGQSPTDDPYDAKSSPDGWRDTNGGNTGDVTIPAGMSIYFGVLNVEVDAKKILKLQLTWLSGDKSKFAKPTATGYRNGMPVAGYISSGRNKTKIYASWDPCPAWEYVKLTNFSNAPQMIRITPSANPTKCVVAEKSASGDAGDSEDTLNITDARTGILGEMLVPIRLTQFEIYPEHQELNPAVLPMFNAMPHTGNWFGNPSFVDPDGTPRPEGGVAFLSDGLGIMIEDVYALSFTMIESADTRYTLFAFNADMNEWYDYIIDLRELPWYEDFEIYSHDELLHGASDWRGWDDDPAFDAPITDTLSRSAPNSVEVKDDTDIVRPFEGADKGAWTFEAWQYIPSDFASGGGGDFAGSYFVLLNTYQDGGSHEEGHWSVQMQMDSNDGMLKVFHGDGDNTINVPFETDRWVKIQIDIDLEKDWTQVYYDDDLITEYSWTGGVLGEGGGSPTVGAVDFFGNGSTSIHYDDLVLVPIDPPPPPCPADINGDGELNFFDVSAFLSAFAKQDPIADFTGDGQFNFFDVSAYLLAFAAGCP